MKADASDLKRRAAAAMSIMSESSTTLEKVQSVALLLKGVNRKLDTILYTCEKNCKAIELATTGAYIELAADVLPEESEEQKKRKKALLFFIKSWGDLKNEVSRLQAELDMGHSVTDKSFLSKALAGATGPVAVITVLAVGVLALAQSSVSVVIVNSGCSTLEPSDVPISIPGFSLPSKAIPSGSAETAELPPLTLTVDGTSGTALTLSSSVFHFTINLSSKVTDVTFDNQSMLKKTTTIDLDTKPIHTLTLICKK